MQPWEIVERAKAPDGSELVLARRGDEWVIRAGGHVLMSSRQHGSEELMADIGTRKLPPKPAVLVGGLGMGFTLRRVLDRVGPGARVVASELVPAVVAWNRGPLGPLAGRPLDDARVEVREGDVRAHIGSSHAVFDLILLDVDNGPAALTTSGNEKLYKRTGTEACRRALKPGGTLIVWSAAHDRAFEKRLVHAGFDVEVEQTSARGDKGMRHVLFVARVKEGRTPG